MKQRWLYRQLRGLMKWLHSQKDYWDMFALIPDINNSHYRHEVEQQLQGTLSKLSKPEVIIEFFDLRIIEFEKKMLYHDEFDTLINRAKLTELVFLRKRIKQFIDNAEIEKQKTLQRPFDVVYKKND